MSTPDWTDAHDTLHDVLEEADADGPPAKPVHLEVANDVFLPIYDYDVQDDQIVVRLAPPTFEGASLSGSGPEDWAALAVKLLEHALSDDSGDWGFEDIDFAGIESATTTIKRLLLAAE